MYCKTDGRQDYKPAVITYRMRAIHWYPGQSITIHAGLPTDLLTAGTHTAIVWQIVILSAVRVALALSAKAFSVSQRRGVCALVHVESGTIVGPYNRCAGMAFSFTTPYHSHKFQFPFHSHASQTFVHIPVIFPIYTFPFPPIPNYLTLTTMWNNWWK